MGGDATAAFNLEDETRVDNGVGLLEQFQPPVACDADHSRSSGTEGQRVDCNDGDAGVLAEVD